MSDKKDPFEDIIAHAYSVFGRNDPAFKAAFDSIDYSTKDEKPDFASREDSLLEKMRRSHQANLDAMEQVRVSMEKMAEISNEAMLSRKAELNMHIPVLSEMLKEVDHTSERGKALAFALSEMFNELLNIEKLTQDEN